MEIKIRNIDSNIVSKIDLLARENNQSRNDFLSVEIDRIAHKKDCISLETEYQNILINLTTVLEEHTKLLSLFMDNFIIDTDTVMSINSISKKLQSISCNINEHDFNTTNSDYKDVLVRDMPLSVINRIDELAKSKNISRCDFINLYLRQLTYSNQLKFIDNKYNCLVEKIIGIITFSTNTLAVFSNENIIL